MGLDIYFKEDIEARLAGLEFVTEEVALGEFRRGFQFALEAVRTSFFGAPSIVIIPKRWDITKPRTEKPKKEEYWFNTHPLCI